MSKLSPGTNPLCVLFLWAFVNVLLNSESLAAPIVSLSAKASSQGNAVTAEHVGVDSTAFNPATLTQLRTGPTGIWREYKLIALPFPTYEISPTKPTPEAERFNEVDLFVDDCTGPCLLGENDPRDNPWQPELERLATYIPGYGEIDIDADLFNFIIAPLAAKIYRRPGSRVTFSVPMFAPLGGGAHLTKEDWNIKPMSFSVGALGLAPTIAYKINPNWSVGGSLNFSYSGAKLGLDYRSPGLYLSALNEIFRNMCPPGNSSDFQTCQVESKNPLVSSNSIMHYSFEGKDRVKWGFSFGVLWEPQPWFSWGLAYRHKLIYNLEGEGEITLSDDLFNALKGLTVDSAPISTFVLSGEDLQNNYRVKSSLKLIIPTKIDTGISMKVTSRLKLNIDYHWRESSLNNQMGASINEISGAGGEFFIPFVFVAFINGTYKPGLPQTMDLGTAGLLDMKFKNSGNFAYGISYQYSNRLTLRGGYEKRPNSFDSTKPLGIVGDLKTIGFGLAYKWDHQTTIDIAYLNMSMKNNVLAGESVLTEVQYQPAAYFAGSDLTSFIEVNMFQMSWGKRL